MLWHCDAHNAQPKLKGRRGQGWIMGTTWMGMGPSLSSPSLGFWRGPLENQFFLTPGAHPPFFPKNKKTSNFFRILAHLGAILWPPGSPQGFILGSSGAPKIGFFGPKRGRGKVINVSRDVWCFVEIFQEAIMVTFSFLDFQS